MLVQELTPGTGVSVESSSNDAKVNLKTTIAEITALEDKEVLQKIRDQRGNGFCVLAPIREDDMLINFTSDYVDSNLVFVDDQKPWIFEKVNIANWKLPVYGSVHIVFCTRKAVTYNRRQHYRLWLGCDGTITASGEDTKKPVTIKDVSEGGVAFIIKDPGTLALASVVEVAFSDAGAGKDFKFNAAIIRSEVLQDGRTLFGCRMTNYNEGLSRFINSKQQEHLRNK